MRNWMSRCSEAIFRMGSLATWVAALMCAGGLHAQADLSEVDRKDPAATARAVLDCYRLEDWGCVAKLANPMGRRIIEEMINEGQAHPRYKSIVGVARSPVLQEWDGAIYEIRYFKKKGYIAEKVIEADAHFANPGGGVMAVVVLQLDAPSGRWEFEDINGVSLKDFRSGSQQMPALSE